MARSPAWLGKLGALGAASLVRHWFSTLDSKVAYYNPATDPAHPDNTEYKVYVLWHEYLLYPVHHRPHCNIAMLLSQHRDANVLGLLAQHFGFHLVRGSTFQGGASALRELVRASRHCHLGITPDGPRGPRRVLAQGPVYLASKLQRPIVVLGMGYDRPWRLPSWDRFAIPRPFSRARAIWSDEIRVPPKLDRDGLEAWRLRIEQILLRLTYEAEAWAEAGTSKLGEQPYRQQPHRKRLAIHPPHPLAGPHTRTRTAPESRPTKSTSQAHS